MCGRGLASDDADLVLADPVPNGLDLQAEVVQHGQTSALAYDVWLDTEHTILVDPRSGVLRTRDRASKLMVFVSRAVVAAKASADEVARVADLAHYASWSQR